MRSILWCIRSKVTFLESYGVNTVSSDLKEICEHKSWSHQFFWCQNGEVKVLRRDNTVTVNIIESERPYWVRFPVSIGIGIVTHLTIYPHNQTHVLYYL